MFNNNTNLIFVIIGAAICIFVLFIIGRLYAGSNSVAQIEANIADSQNTAKNDGDKNGDSGLSPLLSPFLSPSPKLTPKLSPFLSPSKTVSPFLSPNLSPSESPAIISNTGHIVINEIGWMGTKAQSSDEWIELFNADYTSVKIDGWILTSNTDDKIVRRGIVGGREYCVIERTDDLTISDKKANLVSGFGSGLNNSGEALVLKDNFGNVIDTVDCSSGWFAGDNKTKQSMERIDANRTGSDPKNWGNNNMSNIHGTDVEGNPIYGTPGQRNSVSI